MKYAGLVASASLFLVACAGGPDSSGEYVAKGALADSLRVWGTIEIPILEAGKTIGSDITLSLMLDEVINEAPGSVTDSTGHFHLLIDQEFVTKGIRMQADKKANYCLNGETKCELKDLPEGRHVLTAQFADGDHRSWGQKHSRGWKIAVEPDSLSQ